MTLKDYLKMSGETPSAFARRIGVTPQAVSYWLKGGRRPSVERMMAISRATDRAVRVADWVGSDA